MNLSLIGFFSLIAQLYCACLQFEAAVSEATLGPLGSERARILSLAEKRAGAGRRGTIKRL